MPNDWRIHRGDVEGGPSGNLLDGCEIRLTADGTAYEFIAVLARTTGAKPPIDKFEFRPFVWRGLIWNIGVDLPESSKEQMKGTWDNNLNAPLVGSAALVGDESGTYTAQASPGAFEEPDKVEGKEDAASASA